jgi:uncharacterized protein
MIAITDHPEGSILPVCAPAQGEHAEDGRANAALTETLRKLLDLKRSQVELISGQTTRNKRFLIRGVKPVELETRLSSALA